MADTEKASDGCKRRQRQFLLGGSVDIRVDYSVGITSLAKVFKPNGVNLSSCRLVPKVETPSDGVSELQVSFLGFDNLITESVVEFQTVCLQYRLLNLQETMALDMALGLRHQIVFEMLRKLFPEKVNGKVLFSCFGTNLMDLAQDLCYAPFLLRGAGSDRGSLIPYSCGNKVMLPDSCIHPVTMLKKAA